MIISASGQASNVATSLPQMGAEKFVFDNIFVTNVDQTKYPTSKISVSKPTGIDSDFVGSGIFNGKKIDLAWSVYNPFTQEVTSDSGTLGSLYQFNGFEIEIYETGLSTTPYSGIIETLEGPTGSVTGLSSGFGITGYTTGDIDLYGPTGDFNTGNHIEVGVVMGVLNSPQKVSPYQDVVNPSYQTFSFFITNKLSGLSGIESGKLLRQDGAQLSLVSGNTYSFNMSGVTSGLDMYISSGSIHDYLTGTPLSGEYHEGVSGRMASYGTATGSLVWALTGKLPQNSGQSAASFSIYSSQNANYWENFLPTNVLVEPASQEIAITGSTTGNLGFLTGITGVVTGVTYLNGITGYISGLIEPKDSNLIYKNNDYRGLGASFFTTSRENVVKMAVRDREGSIRKGTMFLTNTVSRLNNLKSEVEGGKLKISYNSEDSDFRGTKIFISNVLSSGGSFPVDADEESDSLNYYVGTKTGFSLPMKGAVTYYSKIVPFDLFGEGEETGIYRANVDGAELINSPSSELYGQVFSPLIKNLRFDPSEGYKFNFEWETNLENYQFDYRKIKTPRRVERIPQYGPFSGELTKSQNVYKATGNTISYEAKLPIDESQPAATGYYFSGKNGGSSFALPYGTSADGFIANNELSGVNYSFINSGINRELKLYRENTYFFDFSNNAATGNHFYFSLKPIWQQDAYNNEYTEGVSGSRANTGVLKIELTGLEGEEQLYFYSAESGFAGNFKLEDGYLHKYESEVENVVTGYQEKVIQAAAEEESITGLQYAVDYSYSGFSYTSTGAQITRLLAPYKGKTTASLFSINNLENSGIRDVGFTVKLLSDKVLIASESVSGRIPPLSLLTYSMEVDQDSAVTGAGKLGVDNMTGVEGTIFFSTNNGVSGAYQSGINIYTGVNSVEVHKDNLLDPSYITENNPQEGFVKFLNITGTGSGVSTSLNYKITPVDRIGEGEATPVFNAYTIAAGDSSAVNGVFFIENLDSMHIAKSNNKFINFPTPLAVLPGEEINLDYKLYYTGSYKKEYVDYLFTMVSGVQPSGFHIAFSYHIPDTGYALYVRANAEDLSV